MNQVGSNNHTAQKPYRFSEIKNYYDLKAADSSLKQPRKLGLAVNGGMNTLSLLPQKIIGLP